MASEDSIQLEMVNYINSQRKATLLTGELIDVTFIVGSDKVKIPANKTMLTLSNEVFKKQFFGSFKENTKDEVVIPEVNPVAFQHFLNFLNYGETEFSSEIVKEIYELANHYMDDKLKEFCTDQIIASITDTNLFDIQSWSYLHKNDKIREATENYLKNYQMMCLNPDQDGFKTIKKDVLLRILKMNTLNCSEELLLKRVLAWKEANKDQTIDDLIPHIRLELDQNYTILDFFSKSSRTNNQLKGYMGDLMLSDKLTSKFTSTVKKNFCSGFSIILTNYLRQIDIMENFTILIKNVTDDVIIMERRFTTHVSELVVTREFIFEEKLPFDYDDKKVIEYSITFEKDAKRFFSDGKYAFIPYGQVM